MMGRDLRLEHLMQVRPKPRTCAFLVGLAEAAIAGDVGDHHGGKPALHAPFSPGWQRDESQATDRPIMMHGAARVNCGADCRGPTGVVPRIREIAKLSLAKCE